jgi:hypothetical protein
MHKHSQFGNGFGFWNGQNHVTVLITTTFGQKRNNGLPRIKIKISDPNQDG